jgi:hypothetical protein
VEQGDHRAGGLLHDLLDEPERVRRALPEPDERDVGAFPRRRGSDVRDVDLARDHFMPEGGDDRCDKGESVLALIGDEHAQVLCLAMARS